MRKIWTLILSFVVLILVGVSAYLFGQNQGLKNSAVKTQNTKIENNLVLPTTAPSATASASPVASPSPTGSQNIIIDQESNLSAQDLSEIKKRNIEPFLDWEKDQGSEVVLVKVTQNSNVTYPYKFDYVMKSGVNGGFLIQRSADTHLSWFMPECLNGCNFTPAYKAKYPEIVSKY